MLIFIGLCALVIVVIALRKLRTRSSKAGTLGSMSERWLEEHRASRF